MSVSFFRDSRQHDKSVQLINCILDTRGASGGLKRLGTMLGRRRQSVQGGFNRAPSPSKQQFSSLGSRNQSSRDGRPAPSPRTSSSNLREPPIRDNRLSPLAESPTGPTRVHGTNGDLNGSEGHSMLIPETSPQGIAGGATNGARPQSPDVSDVLPPPGPPPSHFRTAGPAEPQQDAEGYSVPAAMNDPISQAQMEAADEAGEQQFKLDIRNEPIREEDADTQAAFSNVAHTLRSAQLAPPSRRGGTLRGRRDVRNTIYVPAPSVASPLEATTTEDTPASPIRAARSAALAALSSEEPTGSDTQSIRSARSLASNANSGVRHPDMHKPGLNTSIVETVSSYFEDGEVKTAAIIGEMAIAFNHPDLESASAGG